MTTTTPTCDCCQAQHESPATLRVVTCPEVIDPRGFYLACVDQEACHARIEEGYEGIPWEEMEDIDRCRKEAEIDRFIAYWSDW